MADFGLSTALLAAGTAAAVGGTALTATSAIKQGEAAQQAAKYQAQQETAAAQQASALATRDAAVKQQKSDVVQSRLRAVAAASGAGAADPTVLDLTSALSSMGEYDVASALYEGSARNLAFINQAAATRYQGEQERTAGIIRGTSSILGTAGSLAMRYG